jgi:isocitrate dehydrogenase
MIVDIGAARLAADPTSFDVVVLPNLYGDVLSDIVAEVLGSVGLAGSANIGSEYAMFEAIHGSAPDIAGANIANPSGLISGSIKMLAHLGHLDTAELIHNAWLKTIEDGVHTADIYSEAMSVVKATTSQFSDAVINNLGKKPATIKTRRFGRVVVPPVMKSPVKPVKTMTGVDVFLDWDEEGRDPAVRHPNSPSLPRAYHAAVSSWTMPPKPSRHCR